jgi:hypothetical protein
MEIRLLSEVIPAEAVYQRQAGELADLVLTLVHPDQKVPE